MKDCKGALVNAAIAARLLGIDARTLRSYIDTGVVEGVIMRPTNGKPRYYVRRTALHALLNAPPR